MMYENILLESGKVFRGSRISGVGGKVVDDTQAFTIIAAGYGVADIIEVDAPPIFTPGVEFEMYVTIKNIGAFTDHLFVRLTNVDTEGVLKEFTSFDPLHSGNIWEQQMLVTLDQTTDFHGLIEAGHTE